MPYIHPLKQCIMSCLMSSCGAGCVITPGRMLMPHVHPPGRSAPCHASCYHILMGMSSRHATVCLISTPLMQCIMPRLMSLCSDDHVITSSHARPVRCWPWHTARQLQASTVPFLTGQMLRSKAYGRCLCRAASCVCAFVHALPSYASC
eukprot:1141380-Pelagomonas_calceolata.AAC.1